VRLARVGLRVPQHGLRARFARHGLDLGSHALHESREGTEQRRVQLAALSCDLVEPVYLGAPSPLVVGDATELVLVLALDGDRRARCGNVGVGPLAHLGQPRQPQVPRRRARRLDLVLDLLQRLRALAAELLAHRTALRTAERHDVVHSGLLVRERRAELSLQLRDTRAQRAAVCLQVGSNGGGRHGG
jgi:hypothetical protein